MPSSVEEVSICTISGLLAGDGCPSEKELVNKRRMPKKCTMVHNLQTDSLGVRVLSEPSKKEN